MTSVVFRLDAGPSVGFGHAARCLKLAGHLHRAGCAVQFAGHFSSSAESAIRQSPHAIELCEPSALTKCGVAVMDLMSDPDNPDAVDEQELARLQANSDATVVIHSGLTMPVAADDITIVGYQPSFVENAPPRRLWGLRFAPVDGSEAGTTPARREPGLAFVALGGAPDWSAHERIVRTLATSPHVRAIDVLASPALSGAPKVDGLPVPITLHRNVPSVFPFFERAEFVVASYGNLCFEALHAGSALIVVGQKQFQAECANMLAQRVLCASAGLVGAGIEDRVKAALVEVRSDIDGYRARGRSAVDGQGIARLSEIVLQAAGRA